MCILSYMLSKYESRRDYINKMKFQGSIWHNEVMILPTVQISGKDVVTCINGQWDI